MIVSDGDNDGDSNSDNDDYDDDDDDDADDDAADDLEDLESMFPILESREMVHNPTCYIRVC
jgi:hypothetical protein